jgi:DHA2 family multidrug resistance protein
MNDRLHFHWNRLIEDINPARPAVQHFLDMQSRRFDPLISDDSGRAAIKLLANLVQREALVLTYNDAIMLLGCLFVAALVVMPLVRHPRATSVSPGAAP